MLIVKFSAIQFCIKIELHLILTSTTAEMVSFKLDLNCWNCIKMFNISYHYIKGLIFKAQILCFSLRLSFYCDLWCLSWFRGKTRKIIIIIIIMWCLPKYLHAMWESLYWCICIFYLRTVWWICGNYFVILCCACIQKIQLYYNQKISTGQNMTCISYHFSYVT